MTLAALTVEMGGKHGNKPRQHVSVSQCADLKLILGLWKAFHKVYEELKL